MKIIDLDKQREADRKKRKDKRKSANGPDDNLKVKMPDGDYYKFSVTYQYGKKNWTFSLWAKSKKDAEKRLMAIKMFPIDINQVYSEIPL